jgi:hypothetical protein
LEENFNACDWGFQSKQQRELGNKDESFFESRDFENLYNDGGELDFGYPPDCFSLYDIVCNSTLPVSDPVLETEEFLEELMNLVEVTSSQIETIKQISEDYQVFDLSFGEEFEKTREMKNPERLAQTMMFSSLLEVETFKDYYNGMNVSDRDDFLIGLGSEGLEYLYRNLVISNQTPKGMVVDFPILGKEATIPFKRVVETLKLKSKDYDLTYFWNDFTLKDVEQIEHQGEDLDGSFLIMNARDDYNYEKLYSYHGQFQYKGNVETEEIYLKLTVGNLEPPLFFSFKIGSSHVESSNG